MESTFFFFKGVKPPLSPNYFFFVSSFFFFVYILFCFVVDPVESAFTFQTGHDIRVA